MSASVTPLDCVMEINAHRVTWPENLEQLIPRSDWQGWKMSGGAAARKFSRVIFRRKFQLVRFFDC